MNIIIIGAGKTGEELIASLLAEDHDIAVIDPLYSVIENIQESYDVLGICGSGVVTETLGEAGAADADLVIAFWDTRSRGTKHVIETCAKLGIPVRIIEMPQES